jgi:hypothetical protein
MMAYRKLSKEVNYKSINDAVIRYPNLKGLELGSTKIWYWKSPHGKDLLMGADWLINRARLPSKQTLENTHSLLGEIKETNPDIIFKMFQGENWSSEGEATKLIQSKGVEHTSMSVGDIIELADGKLLMVNLEGFYQLN